MAVEVRSARFGAQEVRVSSGAGAAEVAAVVQRAMSETAGKAAVYVFLPLLDRAGLAAHLPDAPEAAPWRPFAQTNLYNIVVSDPTGRVPAAATSVEGAHVLFVAGGRFADADADADADDAAGSSAGKTPTVDKAASPPLRVLLARKRGSTRWSFVGGAVDPGEGTDGAVLRETCEELGLTMDALLGATVAAPPASAAAAAAAAGGGGAKAEDTPSCGLLYAGNYHRAVARRHGAWADEDPAMEVNDTCHFYVLPVDEARMTAALEADGATGDGEIEEWAWFDVKDGAPVSTKEGEDRVPLFWTNAQVIKRLGRRGALWAVERDGNTIFQWAKF